MPLDNLIERGVPFPDRVYRHPRRGPYSKHGKALLQMEVGDSILVSNIPATVEQIEQFIFRHKGPERFKLRMTEYGRRVWRVA